MVLSSQSLVMLQRKMASLLMQTTTPVTTRTSWLAWYAAVIAMIIHACIVKCVTLHSSRQFQSQAQVASGFLIMDGYGPAIHH